MLRTLSIVIFLVAQGPFQQTTGLPEPLATPAPPFADLRHAEASRGPFVYADPELGTLFYVESDGRHLSAISCDGKVLWTRDPFVDAKLKRYRFWRPTIDHIGPAHPMHLLVAPDPTARYLAIGFNSSQFGILNVANGDFTFLGQD